MQNDKKVALYYIVNFQVVALSGQAFFSLSNLKLIIIDF